MNKTLKKIFNVVVDILVILVMVVSAFVLISSITSKASGVSSIFGTAFLTVESDSMKPTFSEGDLILSEYTDGQFSRKYEIGDVVTFPMKVDDVNGNKVTVMNTHRIVDIVEDDDLIYYKTQGDNTETNPDPDEELQTNKTIVAKWHEGTVIPGVGKFLHFIKTPLGFFLCILLPMIIFFVYEVIRVIMNIIAYNKEKALEEAQAAVEASELTEEQKQRAIAEYLAQQNIKEDNSEVQTPAADESSETE
jgi:signal peptidase